MKHDPQVPDLHKLWVVHGLRQVCEKKPALLGKVKARHLDPRQGVFSASLNIWLRCDEVSCWESQDGWKQKEKTRGIILGVICTQTAK